MKIGENAAEKILQNGKCCKLPFIAMSLALEWKRAVGFRCFTSNQFLLQLLIAVAAAAAVI